MFRILAAICLAFALTACASSHHSLDDESFASWIQQVTERTKTVRNYQKLPLNANNVDAFFDVTYKAYKGEISREDYKRQLNAMHPNHTATVDWLANQLPK